MKNGKKDRILRILFNTSEKPITKYQISKLAECSASWVGEFINYLQKLGFLDKGNRIIKKKELYDYWINNIPEREHRDYFVKDPLELLGKVNGLEFAFTTYIGEALTQGHLFPSRVDIYIREEDKDSWLNNVLSNALNGKGNLRIIISDKYIFNYVQSVNNETYKTIFRIVSKPQLIIDLLREGGVCQEAAEMLIKREN